MTGFERANKYHVYAADSNGTKLKNLVIFKAVEKSDCCSR